MNDNRKKSIIFFSIVASVIVIGLISWFVVTVIDKGKEYVDGVSDSVNNIAENISSLELDFTSESETITDFETTTEQSTTEEPTTKPEIETIDPMADPFTSVVAGSYTDEDYEKYIKIRIYENGAKRYVYHIDSENKDYEFSKIDEMPEAVALDLVEKLEADGTIIIAGTSSNEPMTTAPKVPTEEERLEMLLQYDKEDLAGMVVSYSFKCNEDQLLVLKAKNNWIKENFGTSFTHNGIEFGWDEVNQTYYMVNYYGEIHHMTSTSTSICGKFYRHVYAYKIADYLGFYGTDYEFYHNMNAFNIDMTLSDDIYTEEKKTVEGSLENNFNYLQQLGWTEVDESDGVSRHWSFESPEGIPAFFSYTPDKEGFITIYIKYPEDEEEKEYEFTIEEYNDLVNNSNWKICSKSGKVGWAFEDPANWTPYIRKYLVISE